MQVDRKRAERAMEKQYIPLGSVAVRIFELKDDAECNVRRFFTTSYNL